MIIPIQHELRQPTSKTGGNETCLACRWAAKLMEWFHSELNTHSLPLTSSEDLACRTWPLKRLLGPAKVSLSLSFVLDYLSTAQRLTTSEQPFIGLLAGFWTSRAAKRMENAHTFDNNNGMREDSLKLDRQSQKAALCVLPQAASG